VLTPTLIQHDRDTEIQTRLQSGLGAAEADTAKTRLLPAKLHKPSGTLRLLSLIGLLLGGGGLLVYSLSLSFRNWVDARLGFTPPLGPDPAPTLTLPSPVASPLPPMQPGSFIQLDVASTAPLPVLPTPPSAELSLNNPGTSAVEGSIAPGSILQVLKKQATAPQELWMQVRVCSVAAESGLVLQGASSPFEQPDNSQPSGAAAGAVNPTPNTAPLPGSTSLPPISPGSSVNPGFTPLAPGATGWVQEAAILPLVLPIASVSLEQRGICSDPTPSELGEPSSPLPGGATPPASVDPGPVISPPGEPGVS
jgi:hypothetical protein